MKSIILLIIPAVMYTACSNSSGASKKEDHQHASLNNEKSYSCPMHPEVKGNKNDSCPKCGMKLTEESHSGSSVHYFMEVKTIPQTIFANQEVNFSFIPKLKGNESRKVDLQVEHEKKIHLIVVNNDLSWFDHIHPEYTHDGSYQVKEKFPAPGNYLAFADYKPKNAGHVVDKITVNVNGTAPAEKEYTSAKLAGSSSNYSFELVAPGEFTTGDLHFSGILKKDGNMMDANKLDNYLGAKAHVVMISMEDKEYLHVHPNVKKGKFDLHASFSKPGVYRAWVQFNAGGELHTIDFTIFVKEGGKTMGHH